MATPAQIVVNRPNAHKSTGLRTGAASRYNALKHGLDADSVLLPGESAEDFQAIVDEYTEMVILATIFEEVHLATLIHTDWLRRLDQQKRREEKERWAEFLPVPRPPVSAAHLASFRQNAHPTPPPPPRPRRARPALRPRPKTRPLQPK